VNPGGGRLSGLAVVEIGLEKYVSIQSTVVAIDTQIMGPADWLPEVIRDGGASFLFHDDGGLKVSNYVK